MAHQQVLARGGLRFIHHPTPLLPPGQLILQALGQQFQSVAIISLNSFYEKEHHKTMFSTSPFVPSKNE